MLHSSVSGETELQVHEHAMLWGIPLECKQRLLAVGERNVSWRSWAASVPRPNLRKSNVYRSKPFTWSIKVEFHKLAFQFAIPIAKIPIGI